MFKRSNISTFKHTYYFIKSRLRAKNRDSSLFPNCGLFEPCSHPRVFYLYSSRSACPEWNRRSSSHQLERESQLPRLHIRESCLSPSSDLIKLLSPLSYGKRNSVPTFQMCLHLTSTPDHEWPGLAKNKTDAYRNQTSVCIICFERLILIYPLYSLE